MLKMRNFFFLLFVVFFFNFYLSLEQKKETFSFLIVDLIFSFSRKYKSYLNIEF